MSEKCFCHFNGYEVKDATAREDIETLKETTIPDLKKSVLYSRNLQVVSSTTTSTILSHESHTTYSINRYVYYRLYGIIEGHYLIKQDTINMLLTAINLETNDIYEYSLKNGTILLTTFLSATYKKSSSSGGSTLYKYIFTYYFEHSYVVIEHYSTNDNFTSSDMEDYIYNLTDVMFVHGYIAENMQYTSVVIDSMGSVNAIDDTNIGYMDTYSKVTMEKEIV